ncbi:uncharacterized protein MESR4 [Euwallacea similis]|uniref:uncharacterized protein MESR4 n=1 Tax=Euwallacea similis TaxID=1736056 RepID=UPI00344D3A0D
MEHGLDVSFPNLSSKYIKSGPELPTMANFPDDLVTENNENNQTIHSLQVNGENTRDGLEKDSSESDALVIDESVPKPKRRTKAKSQIRRLKKSSMLVANESDIVSPHQTVSNAFMSPLRCETNSEQVCNECEPPEDGSDERTPLSLLPSEVPQECPGILSSENTQTSENFSVNSEEVISEPELECNVSQSDNVVQINQEFIAHSNPYFQQSLFELSQLHQPNTCETLTCETTCNSTLKPSINAKPKLTEYAQYLGLQPAIQFKCPKCSKSGFETLLSLQDHFLQCTAIQHSEKCNENGNVSGFKLTRKVFLCSACGTYYENWNLYIHMLEFHKRYICLYCLGMFSVLEDLCQHIESRHNIEPGTKNTLEDFYNTYNEACYLVCCECNQEFNERDDFFYHKCTKPVAKSKPKQVKQVIPPECHVTGDFGAGSNDINQTKSPHDKCRTESEDYICDDKSRNKTSLENSRLAEDAKAAPEQVAHNNVKPEETEMDLSNNSDSDSCSSKSEEYGANMQNTIDTEQNGNSNINKADSHEHDTLGFSGNCEDSQEQDHSMDVSMDALERTEDFSTYIEEPVETRKVPKLSLKLPKPGIYTDNPEDSDDSDKMSLQDVDNIASENENGPLASDPGDDEPVDDTGLDAEVEDSQENLENILHEEHKLPVIPEYNVAGPEIPVVEIELDQPLDKMDIRILLQKCLQATVPTCIYCNHARRIAVNGKQLGLHAITEHRYSAINKSITEEELIPESFNIVIKDSLDELETEYFNLESGFSQEAITFSHVFECFQCYYSTMVHKELYLHNRKFHSKNLLLCIMCKSNFYSYSELICHLCPGVYVLDCDLLFRCCMCVSDDLPSSFRLMVHLRKKHNICDVCLEMCHNQNKLSNHVWKHKLHHFCYRCGIAYRNKPDITRHLFWKHGTESVLCKKCLQKKWPHVYHFCVPPPSFLCEECNLSFSRAVSLKVHKRLHTYEKKHPCTWEDCTDSFISKKLMLKHLKRHTDPPEDIQVHEEEIKVDPELQEEEGEKNDTNKQSEETAENEEASKLVKQKVDVYDLPELNLSESDSSDTESDAEKLDEKVETIDNNLDTTRDIPITETLPEEEQSQILALNDNSIPEQSALEPENNDQPPPEDTSSVMQDIWDNFKTYQANKEKMDHMLIGEPDIREDKTYVPDIPIPVVEEGISLEVALRDHDYSANPETALQPPDALIEVKPSLESAESVDHDYCFQKGDEEDNTVKPVSAVPPPLDYVSDVTKANSPRKRTNSSSSSSSGSDSSCECGSSCSCSDSSSGSSSSSSNSSNSDSSTEEGRKRQQQRRLKRKERNKALDKKGEISEQPKEDVSVINQSDATEMPIKESDLETTESETDEEFYDREPQKFAKKILEEKRAQLLAEMGPNMVPNGSFIESTSRPPTPPEGTMDAEPSVPKKKKKSKKRKKRKSEKKAALEARTYCAAIINAESIVPAPPPTVPYYQQFHQMESQTPTVAPITLSLMRNSPVTVLQTPPLPTFTDTSTLTRQESNASDKSVRASKRRRVPNKFYGYSSDEDGDKSQSVKRTKVEINRTIPAPPSPKLVPPITIKTSVQSSPVITSPRTPTVEPITLKLPKNRHSEKNRRRPPIPPIRLPAPRRPRPPPTNEDSGSDSNESDVDNFPAYQPQVAAGPPQPQLYCYCRCPYDEVSEMIGCDSNDCEIEWFHFECVGIMVPPKGQWFCPDCRKKKQQRLLS